MGLADMHIMHVIDALDVGGAERAAVDLANAMARRGLRISFCTTRRPGLLSAELSPSVAVYHLNRRRRWDWAAVRRFAQIVNAGHVDIVHAHMRSTAALMVLLRTLGWLKVPLLFQDHHGIEEMNATVPKWLSWWGRRVIDQYVGVYPKLCQWARQAGFPEDRIAYISYGIDLARLHHVQPLDVRREFDLPSDRPVGIVVGNIRPEKGTDLLIHLIAESAVAKEAVYLIVGRDADPEFAGLCREAMRGYGLDDVVRLVGARQDVPSLLRGVDFALMPSRSESGPLVLVEYLAAGLPFVSFKVGDLASQMAAKGIPGIVAPGDMGAFRQELERLILLSPEERVARGAIGRTIAEAELSIETKLDEWERVYRQLLSRKSSR